MTSNLGDRQGMRDNGNRNGGDWETRCVTGKGSETLGKRQARSDYGRQGEQTTGNVAGKGSERHGNRQAEGEWQA